MGTKVLISTKISGVQFLIIQKVSKDNNEIIIQKKASNLLSKLFCLEINSNTKDAYIPIAVETMSKIS